ncbi:MAG: c-type cytochrome [Gammaproteobacteria bacterium]
MSGGSHFCLLFSGGAGQLSAFVIVTRVSQGRDDDGLVAVAPIVSAPSVVVNDPGLQRGVELYQQYCQVCHGARGEGVAAFPDLINCSTCNNAQAFFDVTLATMPPGNVGVCDALCTQTITDYWFSPARDDLLGSPVAPLDPAALDGRTLYIQQCQVCHGADGAGVGRYPGILGESRGKFISETVEDMPTADPSLCDQACSTKVADYFFSTVSGAGQGGGNDDD